MSQRTCVPNFIKIEALESTLKSGEPQGLKKEDRKKERNNFYMQFGEFCNHCKKNCFEFWDAVNGIVFFIHVSVHVESFGKIETHKGSQNQL